MSIRATSRLFLLALLLAAGCATDKAAWQNRIGHYTYDQAVNDYGPPDHREQLADGTVVVDWQSRADREIITPHPTLAPPNGLGPATPGFRSTYNPAPSMRMTFGPDGKLRDYKDLTR